MYVSSMNSLFLSPHRDMIEFLLNKHDVDLKHNVKDYHNIMVAYCASEPGKCRSMHSTQAICQSLRRCGLCTEAIT